MNPNRPISPSARMSIPAAACFRTTSSTALLTRPARPAALNGWPCSFAWIISNRSGGRGRLPTWVVNIRSVLCFISLLRSVEGNVKGRSGQHCAQRRNQRHEKIGGGGRDDELVGDLQRAAPPRKAATYLSGACTPAHVGRAINRTNLS